MKIRYKYIGVFTVILMFCLTIFLAELAEARGRGRGGGMRGGGMRSSGFSRGGPAAGGGFSSRSADRQRTRKAPRQETRSQQPRDRDQASQDRQQQREDRQQQRDEARQDRQQQRDEARQDRQQQRDEAREDWQQHQDEAREDRQQQRNQAREDRQDFIEDEWDDHHHYYRGAAFMTGMAVGAAASTNYVYSVPCNTTVTVNSVIYYNCGTTWYSRGYEGGQVVYIVTSAPAGY